MLKRLSFGAIAAICIGTDVFATRCNIHTKSLSTDHFSKNPGSQQSPAYHIVHISDLGIDFNKLLLNEALSPCHGNQTIAMVNGSLRLGQDSQNISTEAKDPSKIDPEISKILGIHDMSQLVPNNSIYSAEVWLNHYKREEQRHYSYLQTYNLSSDLQEKLKSFEAKMAQLFPTAGGSGALQEKKAVLSAPQNIFEKNLTQKISKRENVCEPNSNVSLSYRVMEMVQAAIEKATKILQLNQNRTVALVWTGGHHAQSEETLIRSLIQACPNMLKRLDELIVGILKSLTESLNNIPIVYSIGPYDTFEPFRMPAGPNENLDFLARLWKDAIPRRQMRTFRKGGYYSFDILNNEISGDNSTETIRIRIISLNTYYFARSNDLVCDCDDFESPGRRQLLWLNNQLVDAAEKGMTTYIVGHLAPSRIHYKPGCYAGYMRLLKDFGHGTLESPRVTGQFFDRMHCMQLGPIRTERDLLNMEDERDISNVLLLPRMMKRKKLARCTRFVNLRPNFANITNQTSTNINASTGLNYTSMGTKTAGAPMHGNVSSPVKSTSTVVDPSKTSTYQQVTTSTTSSPSKTASIKPTTTNYTLYNATRENASNITSSNDGKSSISNLSMTSNSTLRGIDSTNVTNSSMAARIPLNQTQVLTKGSNASAPALVIHTCEINHGEDANERRNIAAMMAERRKRDMQRPPTNVVVSKLVIPEQRKVHSSVVPPAENVLESMISDAMRSFFGSEDSEDCDKKLDKVIDEAPCAFEERRWYHNFPRSLQQMPQMLVIQEGSSLPVRPPEDPFNMIQAIAHDQLLPIMKQLNERANPRDLVQKIPNISTISCQKAQRRPAIRKRKDIAVQRPTIFDKILCSHKKKPKRDPLGQCASGSCGMTSSFNILDMDVDGDW